MLHNSNFQKKITFNVTKYTCFINISKTLDLNSLIKNPKKNKLVNLIIAKEKYFSLKISCIEPFKKLESL
jgi:hypothetical protein